MRNNLLHFTVAVAVVVLVGGASLAFAGGAKCAEQHQTADYQKMAEKMAAKGWLGLETEKTASGGYAVKGITKGSPAEKAGLRGDDIITRIGEMEIPDLQAMTNALRSHEPGDTVSIVIHRGDKVTTLRATLGTRGG